MQKYQPDTFQRDLKFLVNANPPHRKRPPGSHSHWFATGVIAILVGVWIGSDPIASIDVAPEAAVRPLAMNFQDTLERRGDRSGNLPSPLDAPTPPAEPIEAPLAAAVAVDFTTPPGFTRPAEASPATPEAAAIDPQFELDTYFDLSGFDLTDGEASVAEGPLPTQPADTDFADQQGDIETFNPHVEFDLAGFDSPNGSGWQVITIKKGDTLGSIFNRLAIDPAVTHRLSRHPDTRLLNSLQTGPHLSVRLSREGRLEALRYDIDALNILEVTLDGEQLSATTEQRTVEIREREVAGTITSSLFQSAARAGLSDQFILTLVSIFKWNIDFNRDLQRGDRFSVIFEEKFVDGRKIATGGIVAAAFEVEGRRHTAVRHVEPDGSVGFYTVEGESLKRAFLRSPVKFSRISSQFSNRRYHPVLKRWKAHKGVDYAASRGTPVLATADGVITSIGRKGGYGKAIVIQHGKSYSTLYGHLNGFAKSLRSGSRVRQGQTIGYVGSTGLATGPHLHYEFRVNGIHENPLTVDVPRALPITGKARETFLRQARFADQRLVALLN